MKKLYLFIAIILLMSACLKNKKLQFCEGVAPDGSGVNCGTKFSTGDLSAVVSTGEGFGADMLTFTVHSNGNKKSLETYRVQVKPDDNKAQALITLDTAGTYIIKVTVNNEVIAEESITAVEL